MQAERTDCTFGVTADRIRAGDVVALASGIEPSTVVASAEYYGYRNGVNCVRIAFEDASGEPYFMPTPGWRTNGVFSPSATFYVSPSAVDQIRTRRHAIDEYYEEFPNG